MSKTVTVVVSSVFAVSVICVLLYTVGYSRGKKVQLQEDFKVQTEYVQQIDSLKGVIHNIETVSNTYNHKYDSLTVELSFLKRKNKELERYYNEKIDNIALYSNSELQRFFTERY